ncbi:hypothetical protein G5714_019534 [Onychostoma macrolepis]|uniref:Uncharacterized protein n=1 Tax=Onychostoma macrolepis TaxID=369639 RepID=A0A7J6BWQ1_9TELE|nr:hypothetical protein G5714_019534 [Onychostoma macrolepis]
MTIVLAARNRQGGVVNTHSGASRLSEWLVFGAECSFPPPRDSIRNAALIPEPFIALDDGHTEPESPETHISAVGAVRPPKRRLCVGATQAEDARFVAIRGFDWLYVGEAIARGHLYSSEAHRNTAGEEKACPLQSVDRDHLPHQPQQACHQPDEDVPPP